MQSLGNMNDFRFGVSLVDDRDILLLNDPTDTSVSAVEDRWLINIQSEQYVTKLAMLTCVIVVGKAATAVENTIDSLLSANPETLNITTIDAAHRPPEIHGQGTYIVIRQLEEAQVAHPATNFIGAQRFPRGDAPNYLRMRLILLEKCAESLGLTLPGLFGGFFFRLADESPVLMVGPLEGFADNQDLLKLVLANNLIQQHYLPQQPALSNTIQFVTDANPDSVQRFFRPDRFHVAL